MGFCPDSCASIELIPNPVGGCDFATRKLSISRLAFFNCNLAIPDPPTDVSIPPLFTDGSIVISSPLRNVVMNDPETEDVVIHDCMSPARFITRRQMTFEDIIAITTVTGTPPDEITNKYADYDFWRDKKKYRMILRYGLIACNGDFWFARNEDGTFMEAYFDIFISGQKLGNAGGTVEIKKGTIDFTGDPLNFYPPDFNLVDLGIQV